MHKLVVNILLCGGISYTYFHNQSINTKMKLIQNEICNIDINQGFLYQENLASIRWSMTLETKFHQLCSRTDHIMTMAIKGREKRDPEVQNHRLLSGSWCTVGFRNSSQNQSKATFPYLSTYHSIVIVWSSQWLHEAKDYSLQSY